MSSSPLEINVFRKGVYIYIYIRQEQLTHRVCARSIYTPMVVKKLMQRFISAFINPCRKSEGDGILNMKLYAAYDFT